MKNTILADVEARKSFIRDTIKSTPVSRTNIIIALARHDHIEPVVFQFLGKNFPMLGAPTWDFIANLPSETQFEIVQYIQDFGLSVSAAILEATGEQFSEDAAYFSELLDVWSRASEPAREMFLKKLGASK